ncbi:transglycosylase domain-containing protein [Isoptericola cucumis]|uniref:transglycosylase domain-containing protein n=1 Tax=Isoptericola cucumis TaxID=1776856 RepID=UPI003208A62F
MARRRRFWNYPRPHKGPVQRWLPSWRIVVGTGLTGAALGAGLFVAAWSTTTIPDGLDQVNNQATTVYWADGKEMGTFAEQKREIVDLADLPPYVGNAVVASEDQTFWTNKGVDPKGIVRAALSNLKGGGTQGASTLTQQYVERYYLDTTTSYAGKAREAIIALKVAQAQPKEEVLGNYLNTIYWGRGTYGIQAASQEYFGKDAKDLTPSEAAMLSGIIPSPVNWDPSINLDQAKARWERSITKMHEQGYITDDEMAKAEFPDFKEKKEASNRRGGQAGYLLSAVRKELVKSESNPDGLYTEEELDTRGLKITTTIDPKLQNAAVDVAKSLPDDASKKVRMSLVSMDPQTGAVRALYGGPDYVKQSLNTATQDVMQAGSTFKPFTLLGALEQGHTLDETFDGNSPKVFPEAKGDDGEPWEVDNFGYYDYGQVSLEQATANSVNTAYAELNEEIGPETTEEVAHRAGIRKKTEIGAEPSNVLGTASVYPIDLARAYSTFAAQGYKTTPHVVEKVETLDGTTVYEGPKSQEKVFEPNDVAAATQAMTKVVEEGSGDTAQELDRPVAGKTGTSQLNRSAWFAGFVPQLTTVVGLRQYETLDLDEGLMAGQETIDPFGEWKAQGLGITGGSWPVRAWTDFMAVATEGMDVEEFPEYVPPQPTYTPDPTPTETEEELVTVPDLTGQDVAAATAELESLGLVASPQAQNSEEPKGRVLQTSGANTEVPVGSTITLVVSTGEPEQPEQVVIPGVEGQPRTAAEQQLRAQGLEVAVTEDYSDDVAPGAVIATDPGSGSSVDQGSTVTLVVSLGPEEEEPPIPTDDPSDDGNNGGGNDDEPGWPLGG